MADNQDTPQFPESAVDKLVADFGKKPSSDKIEEVKVLAETLRPDYERVEKARKLGKQAKEQRRQGRRM